MIVVANNDKAILAEIKTARAKVNHWEQWKNEPSCKKKLGHWRRRLKKALKLAAERGVEIPEDPFAPPPPPPPPPTEAEIQASTLTALRHRIRVDFQIQSGSKGWAPWGETGWSAIVVTTPHYKWCRVKRVNPKTGEVVAKGKVLRKKIVSRDPEQKGKDKPSLPPTEVFVDKPDAEPTATPSTLQEAPTPSGWKPPQARTPEEEAEHAAKMERLMSLLDDESTAEDW